MVKKYILIFMLSILSLKLVAMEYEEFVKIILKNNKEYQKALSYYTIKKMTTFNWQYDWLPKVDLNFNYLANSNIHAKNQAHAFSAGLSIKQPLPLYMGLDFDFDNIFVYSKINGIKSEYSAAGKFVFSIPLYFFAPSLVKPYSSDEMFAKRKALDTAFLELKQQKEKIIVHAIYTLGSYWLQKEMLTVEEEKSVIDIERGVNDQALWAQGKLSTFELSERETDRYNNKVKFLNFKKDYLKMIQNLKLVGFNKQMKLFDIEVWIKSIENYIQKNYTPADTELLIQENNIRINRYFNLLKEMRRIPRFTFSFKLNPDAELNKGDKLTHIIKNYWTSKKNWQCNLALGFSIPLSPLDEVYKINHTAQEILRISELNYQKLQEIYKNKKELHKIDLDILHDQCKLAEEFRLNIFNRLSVANTLLKQGYITKIDLKTQNLDYRLAELRSLETRLNYIVAVLSSNF